MEDLMLWRGQANDLEYTCEILIPDQESGAGGDAASFDGEKLSWKFIENEDFHDDTVCVEFDKKIDRADKWDYIVAASSGTLTAALDLLWVGEISLEKAQTWGREETEKFVIKAARALGYQGEDLQGAIRMLEKLAPIAADQLTNDFGGGLQHHLRDFSHHPTLAGLVFSILTQFTRYGYGTDTDGNFIVRAVPNDERIGKNFAEKIFNGVVLWGIHLISDLAGSSQNPGKGTGIPGMLLSFLKELSVLPVFKEISLDYKDKEIRFSQLLSKLFNGTFFVDEKTGKRIRFDLRTEIGLAGQLTRQAVPVVINECIVRGFYTIRMLCQEISDKNILHFSDLERMDLERIVPANNRALTRMLTVSSGTFNAVVIGGAAVKAACQGDKARTAEVFFLNLNYIGIVRFVFACKADAKYIGEDFVNAVKAFRHTRYYASAGEISGMEYLSLTQLQTRILYTLELRKVQYDIQNTGKMEDAELKSQWIDNWKQALLEGIPSDERENFFLSNARLYSSIVDESAESIDWLYLTAMELSLFDPYYPLNKESEDSCKKMKYRANYEKDVFCAQQKILSYDTLEKLMKQYKKSVDELGCRLQKTAAGVAIAAAASLATGGLAWIMAPKIAVMLMGPAFLGLHGAALTSASLAAIGGGSLAVGGLGMAGGTAIITGGGALLGIAGSGAVSSIVMMNSKEYAINECAKLMTVCREVIAKNHGAEAVSDIQQTLMKGICEFESKLEGIANTSDMDEKEKKRLLKEGEESVKYLKRCNEALLKLCVIKK